MNVTELCDPTSRRPALEDEDAKMAARNAETAFALHGGGCEDDGNGSAVCSCRRDYDEPCPIHGMNRPH